jgi:hypothetical protein
VAEINRENFAQRVIDVVHDKFPLVKIARAEQSFSLKVNGHVASLENLYRMAILRPDDTQRHIERWAVELLRAAEGTPDQHAAFDEVRERVLPMLLSEQAGEVQSATMVTQPFVAGLHIGYGIDRDRTIAYVPQIAFKEWNIELDDLHATALQNLVARSESIAAQAAQDPDGRINLIIFQTMDGFDASRLLLPTLHDRLSEHLGSPFAAGVPNRDILLCFRNDDETVARLRHQISEDFRNMPHPVTEKLLLVTPDGIAQRD